MSTAAAVDHASVPALGVEGKKDVAVVTPDAVEEPKSAEPSNDIKASRLTYSLPLSPLCLSFAFPSSQTINALEPSPLVAEAATTPALDLAESAAPLDSATIVKPAHEGSAPIADSSVVKSAVEGSDTAPMTNAAVDAPVVAVDSSKTLPAVEQTEGTKDVKDADAKKENVKDKVKKEKREKKTKKSLLSRLSGIFSFHEHKSSSGTSSSSSDEETVAAKPHAKAPKTTITPATPSKETTPNISEAAPGSTSAVSATDAAPVVAPSVSAETTSSKADKTDDVAAALDKLQLEEKGKETVKPVVGKAAGGPAEVEECHCSSHIGSQEPNPVAAAKPVDIPASVEEKKEKPSPSASPNPKMHRRISARIGQFMDFGKKKHPAGAAEDKTKDGDSFISGSAEVAAHSAVPAPAAVGGADAGPEGPSVAPVLGEPIKVEPMGDLIPAKETNEPVKPIV